MYHKGVCCLQYCRVPKNGGGGGGYSPPAWTVLIFPKSSRFRSYFKRAPRSYFKRARVHVHVQSCTCTCTCTYAHVMSYYMYRCMIFLCGTVERSYFACQKKLLFSNERSKLSPSHCTCTCTASKLILNSFF